MDSPRRIPFREAQPPPKHRLKSGCSCCLQLITNIDMAKRVCLKKIEGTKEPVRRGRSSQPHWSLSTPPHERTTLQGGGRPRRFATQYPHIQMQNLSGELTAKGLVFIVSSQYAPSSAVLNCIFSPVMYNKKMKTKRRALGRPHFYLPTPFLSFFFSF